MTDLSAARIETVRRHMALETTHDWDGVIATFAHPRYEMYGAGQVFDGEAAVRGYFAASRTPFPDQANEIIAIAHVDDTVLVEFWLTGPHTGPLRAGGRTIAPTGKSLRVHMSATFEFAPAPTKSSASGRTSIKARCCGRWGLRELMSAPSPAAREKVVERSETG